MSFYESHELAALGLKSFGTDVRISRKASIYNAANIAIGNHVRIDDYCVLSAGQGSIVIGNYVHIAVYCSLLGQGKITLCDFSGLSARVSIFSSNDDYSGEWLTNPTVPSTLSNVASADVYIGRHVIIGAGSVVLPGLILEDGCAIGSLSLVNKSCQAFTIYQGAPIRKVADRKQTLLQLETKV